MYAAVCCTSLSVDEGGVLDGMNCLELNCLGYFNLRCMRRIGYL